MANYASWGSFGGQPANVWDDAPVFNDDYQWTKYFFTANENAVCWNNARCIQLLINRCNYLANLISAAEPPELTWKAICEAWIKNDFEGRAATIAIIDRMRQILWNEPFSVQWAAKPTLPED